MNEKRVPTLVDPFELGAGATPAPPKTNGEASVETNGKPGAHANGAAGAAAHGKPNGPPERRLDGPAKAMPIGAPGVETWARMRCWCSED